MTFDFTRPGFQDLTDSKLNAVELFFRKNPEKIFLSRKDASKLNSLSKVEYQNSFIYDQTKKILYVKEDTHTHRADSAEQTYYLGFGVYGQIKYVQDVSGNLYALKISNPEKFNDNERSSKTLTIMYTLGKLFFTAERSDSVTQKIFFKPETYKKNIKEYQILKFEPGQQLVSYLTHNNQPLIYSLQDRLRIAIAVTKELISLHQQNIIHGDLSILNIMVDFRHDGTIQVGIIDYDRAIRLEHRGQSINVGTQYEYSYYYPPETTNGQWSQKVDIYSLGACLFGHYLDPTNTIADNAWHLLSIKEVSTDLIAIANRMIDKEPDSRPLAEYVLDALCKEYNKELSRQKISAIPAEKQRSTTDLATQTKQEITNSLEIYIKSRRKNIYITFRKYFHFYQIVPSE
jgi:serine/threonine protein kinase